MHPRTFWKHFSLVLKSGSKIFQMSYYAQWFMGWWKIWVYIENNDIYSQYFDVCMCVNWSTILIQCFWRNYSIKNIANPKTRGPSLKVLGNFFANLSGIFLLVLISCCCSFCLYDILRKNCDFRRLWRGIVSSRSEK